MSNCRTLSERLPGVRATTVTGIAFSPASTSRRIDSVTVTTRVAGSSWCGGRRSNRSTCVGTSQWPTSPKQPPWPKIQNDPA